MNTKRLFTILALAAALLGCAPAARAVDGVTIHAQNGTNVMLRYPSQPGQTCLIIYTTNLADTGPWTVLAEDYPAAGGTNETTFIHPGQLPAPAPRTAGVKTGLLNLGTPSLNTAAPWSASLPLLMPADGTGAPVPVCLFPPGLDLSGFSVLEPDGSVSAWTPVQKSSSGLAASGAGLNGFTPAPKTPAGNPEESGLDVSCGFYRVLGVKVLSGLTNGATLSGFFTVTVKPDAGVEYLDLLVDGQPIRGEFALTPPFTNTVTFEDFNSARLANGPHTVQVEAVYHIESPDDGGTYQTLSQPFQMTVFNEISFPNWEDMTEDEVFNFDIVSAHTNVDWEIDIYSYYDYLYWYYGYLPQIWPIHVQTGHTTNGIIEYDWDFWGDDGYRHNDPYYDPYFVSFVHTSWSASSSPAGGPSPKAGGGATAPTPVKNQPPKWPEQGRWVVSWQDMFRHFQDQNGQFAAAFNWLLSMANIPAGDGPASVPFFARPTGGTNAQTFPLRYEYPRADLNPAGLNLPLCISYDEELLCLMLQHPDSRNFFYFGHANVNRLAEGITPLVLEAFGAGMHRYRFVWLDGCLSGSLKWSAVFGIPGPGVFNLDYYKERTKRPALFVGNQYKVPLGIPWKPRFNGYDGEIPQVRSVFYTEFIFYWQVQGHPYNQAVDEAQSHAKAAYPNKVMHYISGPKIGQPYWPGDDQIRIGYDEMRYNEYNTRNDIPHR